MTIGSLLCMLLGVDGTPEVYVGKHLPHCNRLRACNRVELRSGAYQDPYPACIDMTLVAQHDAAAAAA